MEKTVDLIKHAYECYSQARASLNPLVKQQLVARGDEYLKRAEEMKRGRADASPTTGEPSLS